MSIGVPHYLKVVECAYEIFHKLKWHKVRKQLPLTYMENSFSVPRPPKWVSQMLRHSSKLGHPNAEMPGVVLGKEPGGAALTARGGHCLYRAWLVHCKTNAKHYFHFSPLFVRVKTLFGFLLGSTDTNVGLP